MPYLTSSLIPTGSMDGYQAITAALPEGSPTGMLARYVGMSDDGLAITVVWASKTDADRFETEHLLPTIRRLMGPADPDSGSTMFSYEATDVVYGHADVGA